MNFFYSILLLVTVVYTAAFGQSNFTANYKYVHNNPSIGFGIGTSHYFGDLSKDKTLSGARITSFGGQLNYMHPLSNSVVARCNLNYNQLGQFGMDTSSNYHNIKTTIYGLDLGVRYRIDNDILLSSQLPFSVFAGGGFGFAFFNVKEDQKDASNNYYNYWSDGSVRSVAENDLDASNASVIQKNYDFETSINTSKNTFLYTYIELGFALKITANLNAQFSYKHNFAFTDELDGISTNSQKDKYVFLSTGFNWYFGKPKRTNTEILQEKAAEKIHLEDKDDDGVPDVNDFCPKTPRGWSVDSKGCPLDDDEDGVPNNSDKELKTPKGNLVNKEGVTITEEEIEVLYLLQTGEMEGNPNYQLYKSKYPKLFQLFYGEEIIQKNESISE